MTYSKVDGELHGGMRDGKSGFDEEAGGGAPKTILNLRLGQMLTGLHFLCLVILDVVGKPQQSLENVQRTTSHEALATCASESSLIRSSVRRRCERGEK